MEDFLAWAVKVPVEVAVEVASSSLLFTSFVFYSFSSKRVLDYASSQLQRIRIGLFNKKIQHFLLWELSLCNGNHFLVMTTLSIRKRSVAGSIRCEIWANISRYVS